MKRFRFSSFHRLRVGNHGQPKVELPMVEFSSKDVFKFKPLALDIGDLGMRFRFTRWSASEDGYCNAVSMCYVSPSHQKPAKAAELRLVDLSATNVVPDPRSSDSGRQESFISDHQRLYPSECKEQWFLHMYKRTVELEACPGTAAVLDFWIGPNREYWLWRAFIDQVAFQALFSGFKRRDAWAVMTRLVRVAPDSDLADWHDREHRAYIEAYVKSTEE